ncbi:hypothetical protein JW960_09200 [candidate division KSB1 bacterium]|nr:hypothetical protein [candidate division KSB1 bacterium]
MIECIFSLDYEIYGNGSGSLRELVFGPAEQLRRLFLKQNSRFVTFVEAAELEMIELKDADLTIELVKEQIRDLHRLGFEIGLHVHPQWYNGQYQNGSWQLNQNEYNLCVLPGQRIDDIIRRSLDYLRKILDEPEFTPVAFRNGNWLFQPTEHLASVLAAQKFKLDSSVFKGGIQRLHHLDYRRALKNGYYWRFDGDVNIPDPQGKLLEIPIYSTMAFPWHMVGKKRLTLQNKAAARYSIASKLERVRDYMRLRQPLKLDFCRLTLAELIRMIQPVIEGDRNDPESFKPIVLIGHTKDLIDLESVDIFIDYLHESGIPISQFKDVYERCQSNLEN